MVELELTSDAAAADIAGVGRTRKPGFHASSLLLTGESTSSACAVLVWYRCAPGSRRPPAGRREPSSSSAGRATSPPADERGVRGTGVVPLRSWPTDRPQPTSPADVHPIAARVGSRVHPPGAELELGWSSDQPQPDRRAASPPARGKRARARRARYWCGTAALLAARPAPADVHPGDASRARARLVERPAPADELGVRGTGVVPLRSWPTDRPQPTSTRSPHGETNSARVVLVWYRGALRWAHQPAPRVKKWPPWYHVGTVPAWYRTDTTPARYHAGTASVSYWCGT